MTRSCKLCAGAALAAAWVATGLLPDRADFHLTLVALALTCMTGIARLAPAAGYENYIVPLAALGFAAVAALALAGGLP